MTKHPEIFSALAAPFHPSDVKQRDGQGRNKLSYITARTVLNRLDEVMGPEAWQFELAPWGDNALIGTLILTMPDGSIVRKSDVGGRAGMKTGDDDAKSAASDVLKRCAVLVGIGRYLYNDGQVSFSGAGPALAANGPSKPQDTRTPTERLIDWAAKEGHTGRLQAIANSVYGCQPDGLSAVQAQKVYKLIKDSGAVAEVPQPPPRPPNVESPPPVLPPTSGAGPAPGKNANGNAVKFGWPHSGVSLFAWMKNLEKAFGLSLIQPLRDQFSGQHLPPDQRLDPTFRTWNPHQVEAGAVLVAKRVASLEGYSGEFDGHLPVSVQSLRDKLWTVAGQLTEALGEKPTSEAIELQIQNTSQSLAERFGGEVIGEVETCENQKMLEAVLEIMEQDLKDSQTFQEV